MKLRYIDSRHAIFSWIGGFSYNTIYIRNYLHIRVSLCCTHFMVLSLSTYKTDRRHVERGNVFWNVPQKYIFIRRSDILSDVIHVCSSVFSKAQRKRGIHYTCLLLLLCFVGASCWVLWLWSLLTRERAASTTNRIWAIAQPWTKKCLSKVKSEKNSNKPSVFRLQIILLQPELCRSSLGLKA